MLNVLLISPRLAAGDSRRSGDHAYTDLLIEHPPDGVCIHHYEDLIADGRMSRIRSLDLLGFNLMRIGFLPPDMWAEYLVTSEHFDLVHVVAFSTKVILPQPQTPIILHASSPSITDLMVKRQWSRIRIERSYRRYRKYLEFFDVRHYALNPGGSSAILVQSDYGRRLLLEYGRMPPEKLHVLYPAQPARVGNAAKSCASQRPITFLFVGSDFERKNGPLLLEAFQQLRSQVGDNVRLLVVGRPSDGRQISMPGVEHRLFVNHEVLMNEVFPQAAVFVLPTAAEGSFAFTVFEAMSIGLPVITVDAWGMPEIVLHGENGLLVQPNSQQDLVEKMATIATQPELAVKMGQRSLQVLKDKFSIETHSRQLMGVYDRALRRS